MGDMYKEIGGWKGVQNNILKPLAQYQISQGMNTPLTKLYNVYQKVDPIWRKMHPDKDPASTTGTTATPGGTVAATIGGAAGAIGGAGTNAPQGGDADFTFSIPGFGRNKTSALSLLNGANLSPAIDFLSKGQRDDIPSWATRDLGKVIADGQARFGQDYDSSPFLQRVNTILSTGQNQEEFDKEYSQAFFDRMRQQFARPWDRNQGGGFY